MNQKCWTLLKGDSFESESAGQKEEITKWDQEKNMKEVFIWDHQLSETAKGYIG